MFQESVPSGAGSLVGCDQGEEIEDIRDFQQEELAPAQSHGLHGFQTEI